MWKTDQAILNGTEYRKLDDATWRAEFRGGMHVSVTAPTLEECRMAIMTAFDDKFVQMLQGHASAQPAARQRKQARLGKTMRGVKRSATASGRTLRRR